MRKAWRLPLTLTVLWSIAALPCAHAETQWAAASGATPTSPLLHRIPMDDHELMAVQGAGMDVATLMALQQTRGPRAQDDDARRQRAEAAQAAQTTQALAATLALQTDMTVRLRTSAVNSINTAAQIGGTLIALTPVTAIAPIGLPLFGLPSLPPRNSH